jgi:hypothetical protein
LDLQGRSQGTGRCTIPLLLTGGFDVVTVVQYPNSLSATQAFISRVHSLPLYHLDPRAWGRSLWCFPPTPYLNFYCPTTVSLCFVPGCACGTCSPMGILYGPFGWFPPTASFSTIMRHPPLHRRPKRRTSSLHLLSLRSSSFCTHAPKQSTQRETLTITYTLPPTPDASTRGDSDDPSRPLPLLPLPQFRYISRHSTLASTSLDDSP